MRWGNIIGCGVRYDPYLSKQKISRQQTVWGRGRIMYDNDDDDGDDDDDED